VGLSQIIFSLVRNVFAQRDLRVIEGHRVLLEHKNSTVDIDVRFSPHPRLKLSGKKASFSASPGSFRVADHGNHLSLYFSESVPGLYIKRHDSGFKFSFSENGKPCIELIENGITRAILGSKEFESKETGTTMKRKTGSLVLLDENGKVIWSAPE